MLFFKNSSMSRFMLLSLFLLFMFSLFSVTAQESFFTTLFGSSSEGVVTLDEADDEGLILLDMDDDQYVTEEDLYLRLELINEQITNASTNLTYLQSIYGLTVTLTPITTNTAVKNSANTVEYKSLLPQTRTELVTLAEQINGLQNQIGDLDLTDENIVLIKQYFDVMDENIYYALWYTGRG